MKAGIKDLMKELWLRSRNNGDIIWETRDGKVIPINEMTDTHLVNTINMLLRQEAEKEMYYEALSSGPDNM